MALTANDITAQNFRDFYQQIFPYLNKGNGGLSECPLGMTAFFEDTVAPDGWLVADGSVYDIVDYPDLANHYERVYGSKNHWGGNGTTTFGVPDLQGEFLRASGTNSHTNQGSGGAVGEHQDGTIHQSANGNTATSINTSNTGMNINMIDADYKQQKERLSFDGGTKFSADEWAGIYTSRPTNTSLLLCIKAVPSGDLYNYSTNERRVGTWIDGRPVYEKTFNGVSIGAVTANTWSNLFSDSSLDGCKIKEFIGIDATTDYSLNYNNVKIDGTTLKVYGTITENARTNVDITLQYTKTTD